MKRLGHWLTVSSLTVAASLLVLPYGKAGLAAETVIHVSSAASDIGAVNRRVLGGNALAYLYADPHYSAEGAGMWNPKENRSVPEMIRLARESGVSTLRWPGGCGVHEYNWKLTVGPKENRPQQPFGLPEFLRVAEEIGAEPVITLADYWGEPEDAADLVEYLNGPLGKNPNGSRDWAAVRASDGHPEPYRVVWFEYGNETAHGTHRVGAATYSGTRRYAADEYALRYRAFRTAMKAVDSSIRLGAVLNNDETPVFSRWTETVIKQTGDVADFFIQHPYLPVYSGNDGKPNATELFRIAFASSRQFDAVFKRLNEYILNETGRHIPLAATEYNSLFVQDKPVPYRLSLGTAVQVADLVQVLLDPRNNIAHAQYWQFANEYWGMIKGYTAPYTLRPAYHVFRLYHDHLGDRLLETKIDGVGYEQGGGFRVVPARGKGSSFELLGTQQLLVPNWKFGWVIGANAKQEADGTLGVEITTDGDLNYHAAQMTMPAQPNTGYRITAEIRAVGLTRLGAQLQVGDARGWGATKSSTLSNMVNDDRWTEVHADYVTLPDTKEIQIMARRLGSSPERGRFWIRNVRVQRFQPFTLPKIPFVGAIATRKGNRIALFLVNRRIDGTSPVRIDITKGIQARGWSLSGPSVDATNETDPVNVKVDGLAVETTGDALRAVLPPHSFSVIEFDLPEQTRKKQ